MIRPWLIAARPKTLTAALIPFTAGAALSYRTEGALQISILLLCITCALLIQIATNLINDALDCKRGGDTDRRLGPTRVCHAGLLSVHEVLRAGIILLFLAAILGLPLILRGGLELSILFGISILCGYAYTGGPYALSTNGLGELFSFLFFGLVATAASFFLQTHYWSVGSILLGGQIGLLTAAIAAINNFRDMEEDRSTGKKTLVVRFGPEFGKPFITALLLLPYPLGLYWVLEGYPFAAVLPLLALPLALYLTVKVHTTPPSKVYNKFLGLSALHHFLFGTLYTVGLFC